MKTLRKGIAVLSAGWTLVCASGCATLISGTHQTLDINAQPPGSEVTLYRWNGEVVAGPIKAPASASVHRPKWNHPYLAVASKEGTCPRYWVPTTSFSPGGWVDLIVDLATLGLAYPVSLLPDGSNGSTFKLDESEFNNITLQEEPCGK
jgi:hypothetical protein